MKKKLSSVIICMLFLFTFQAKAQFQDYTWDEFKVKFSIPTTHKVLKSSSAEFESGDKQTWLQMFPYKDETETAKGMIIKVAEEANVSILDEGAYKVGGYDGYWITCETKQYPDWQFWYIGLIDPKSDVNFYAIIWFKKGDDKATQIAQTMSSKFKKM